MVIALRLQIAQLPTQAPSAPGLPSGRLSGVPSAPTVYVPRIQAEALATMSCSSTGLRAFTVLLTASREYCIDSELRACAWGRVRLDVVRNSTRRCVNAHCRRLNDLRGRNSAGWAATRRRPAGPGGAAPRTPPPARCSHRDTRRGVLPRPTAPLPRPPCPCNSGPDLPAHTHTRHAAGAARVRGPWRVARGVVWATGVVR